MALPAQDNFNRADNASLGANWTMIEGDFDIFGNGVSTAGVESGAFWNADTFPNDQYAQAVIVASANHGVSVRAGGTSTATRYGYECVAHSGVTDFVVVRTAGGGYTILGNLSGDYAASDVMRLEASGTTITAYKNGTQVGQWTDSALSAGSGGINSYGNLYPTIDDWEAGSLGVVYTYWGLESGTGAWSLEDGTGKWLLEQGVSFISLVTSCTISRSGSTAGTVDVVVSSTVVQGRSGTTSGSVQNNLDSSGTPTRSSITDITAVASVSSSCTLSKSGSTDLVALISLISAITQQRLGTTSGTIDVVLASSVQQGRTSVTVATVSLSISITGATDRSASTILSAPAEIVTLGIPSRTGSLTGTVDVRLDTTVTQSRTGVSVGTVDVTAVSSLVQGRSSSTVLASFVIVDTTGSTGRSSVTALTAEVKIGTTVVQQKSSSTVGAVASDISTTGASGRSSSTAGTITAALWTPANLIVQPRRWFDAQTLSSITKDGSNRVSAIANLGTAGGSATESTNKPLYQASSINGKPAVNFDTLNAKLSFTGALAGISRISNSSGLFDRWRVFYDGVATVSALYSDIRNPLIYSFLWNGTDQRNWEDGNVASNFTGALSPVSIGAIFIIAATSGPGSGWTQNTRVYESGVLGNLAAGGGALNGPIGEFIDLGYEPNTAERQLIEGYMAWRWGREALLPASHPYKAAAPTVMDVDNITTSCTHARSGVNALAVAANIISASIAGRSSSTALVVENAIIAVLQQIRSGVTDGSVLVTVNTTAAVARGGVTTGSVGVQVGSTLAQNRTQITVLSAGTLIDSSGTQQRTGVTAGVLVVQVAAASQQVRSGQVIIEVIGIAGVTTDVVQSRGGTTQVAVEVKVSSTATALRSGSTILEALASVVSILTQARTGATTLAVLAGLQSDVTRFVISTTDGDVEVTVSSDIEQYREAETVLTALTGIVSAVTQERFSLTELARFDPADLLATIGKFLPIDTSPRLKVILTEAVVKTVKTEPTVAEVRSSPTLKSVHNDPKLKDVDNEPILVRTYEQG